MDNAISPAIEKACAELAASARKAAEEAIRAGADGLADEEAFWRNVERLLGKDHVLPLFAKGPKAVAVECAVRITTVRKMDFAKALALRTLREAALRRVA